MRREGRGVRRERPALLALGALACAASLAGLLPARSGADAGSYVSQRRQIRVGIIATRALNMPDGSGSENPDPHVFYVLDARTDLKPIGLEFVNPLAPPTITGEIHERWRKRSRGNDPAFTPGNALYEMFRVGAKVTKNMGAYWEVNIDALDASDLQQFDLLFMHSHKADVALPADTREKLRAYMDSGGTLWAEQCGGFTFNRHTPFFFDAQWRSGGSAGGPGRAGAVIGSPNHPLLNAPYVLSPEEVQRLGDKNVGGWYIFNPYDPNDPGYYDPSAGKNSLNPPGRETLVPVVWNTRGFAAGPGGTANPDWRPYVLAGAVGAGKLILSAQDTGCAINDYVGGVQVGFGGNCGAISGSNLLAAKPQDLKLAYNMAQWAVSHRTAYADVRRTGSATETIAAQLDEKWSAPGGGMSRVGGAAFFKRCVYVVGGDLVLRCFDANPGQDLDGDGNPDEGLVDFSAGAPYDCIWALDLKQFDGGTPLTGASTPTVIEFFDTNPPTAGGLLTLLTRELVVVTLSNGTVVAARALPQTLKTVNGQQTYAAFADFTNVDWAVAPAQTGAREFALGPADPIPAPAFSEGVVFATLNTNSGGRVLVIDPFTGGSPFHYGSPAGTGEGLVPDVPGTEALRGAPTVGYVRDTLTGATDKMVYINVSPRTGQPGSVRAIPFGVKGEPLTLVPAPDRLFRSRARSPWYIYMGVGNNPFLRPRVTCVFRDPTDGTYGSRELQYTSADPPGANQWHEKFDMGEARVKIGATVELTNVERPNGTRVGLRTVTPTDANVTFVADYVYDWAPPVGSTFPKVNARSVFVAPDPTDTNNHIVGTVALSRDDTAYFAGNAANDAATYPGRGVLIAASEQSANRSIVRWTYSLYDAFTMSVNGERRTVPARLRRTNGDFLIRMRFIGTPAVRDGTVYAVASGTTVGGQGVSALVAFRTEQEFVLRLNTRIDSGTRVRIRQPNLFVDRNAQPEAWLELAAGQYSP
ncbi:MAG: DUF4159 domain-containing protein, partial [Armatimonadetes bacterium]|nr:DUF4159 domain-containing protein [Armatimonadota bacterium]